MKFNRKNKIVIYTGSVLVVILLSVFLYIGSQINTRVIPQGSIDISTQYSKYIVGEEIKFKITNKFNSAIYVENNCPTEPLDVYRYEDAKWVRLHSEANDKSCSSSERKVSIPANGSRESSFANWPKLFDQPGLYRIVAYVDYYNQLPYVDFEIVNKPDVPKVPETTGASNSGTANQNASPNTGPDTSVPAQTGRISKTISIPQGSISVEYADGMIYVTSINPATGYTYEGGRSGPEVEVTFKNGSSEVQIKLKIVNGQLVQEIENGD